MEPKRQEHIESFQSLVSGSEVAFGEGIGVAKVQSSIAVGIRESNEELFFIWLRVGFVDVFSYPDLLDFFFDLNESISFAGVLVGGH